MANLEEDTWSVATIGKIKHRAHSNSNLNCPNFNKNLLSLKLNLILLSHPRLLCTLCLSNLM
jgi:hypothetical protein